jgi:hypothetical protein
MEYFNLDVKYLEERGIENPLSFMDESLEPQSSHCGCPGSKEMYLDVVETAEDEIGKRNSQLTQWPIQLHLISPLAGYYKNSHLLLAADCCAFAYGDFHKDFMKGKSIAIACPKLDSGQEIYLEKLKALIQQADLQSITVAIMQVPCCSGLLRLAQQALEESNSSIFLNLVIIGVNGEILKEMNLSEQLVM